MPQTAIVTGAGGAIAAAVIEVFRTDWQLALFGHSRTSCDRLRERYPESLVVQADLTDEARSREAVSQTAQHFGQIDALLNIAGGFAMSAANETSREDLDKQLGINFRTLFNATRAVLPGMLEQHAGFILGVGAAPALRGGARVGAYAASKGAVSSYLKSLAVELEPRGIGVSILYPMGAVDTPANCRSMPKADPEKWIDPHELAESVRFLATRSPRGRVRELLVYPPA